MGQLHLVGHTNTGSVLSRDVIFSVYKHTKPTFYTKKTSGSITNSESNIHFGKVAFINTVDGLVC